MLILNTREALNGETPNHGFPKGQRHFYGRYLPKSSLNPKPFFNVEALGSTM